MRSQSLMTRPLVPEMRQKKPGSEAELKPIRSCAIISDMAPVSVGHYGAPELDRFNDRVSKGFVARADHGCKVKVCRTHGMSPTLCNRPRAGSKASRHQPAVFAPGRGRNSSQQCQGAGAIAAEIIIYNKIAER